MSDTPSITLVTGAVGALGSAVTSELRGRGHRVIAVDRVEPPTRTDGVTYLQVDVASREAWKSALASLADEWKTITGAVLCAGGWGGGSPVHAEADDDTWQRMLTINLETAQQSLRALLSGMVSRGRGSIVVVGSRAVARPWEASGAAAYAAAKSGLVTFAEAIAAETADKGVRVNAVLPNTLDTPANRAAMPDVDPSEWVSCDSLAAVAAFLLSDDARDVTGAAIPVYGRV